MKPQRLQLDPLARDPVALQRVGAAVARARPACGPAPRAPPEREAERPALVQQRRHRDLPAAADLAEQVLGGHVGRREEDLVELGLAGDLAQRPHLDPGRVHVDDQVREPRVPLRLGVAAREQDAEVGEVRERRPDLLAVDDEVAVLDARARAHAREVGAGARLGEPLAPDLLGGEDLRQVARLLLLGPWAMIVGPAMPRPITPTCGGASARAISSRKIAWCVYGAPPPPYSFGHVSPA